MKRILKFTALSLAALFTAVAIVSTASAHVELASSVPAGGSTVSAAPTSVVLTFAGEIQKTAGKFELDVTNDAGASVTAGTPTVSADGEGLSVVLQPGLSAGTYTVTWMNTSADDGDAEEGTFTFAVGGAPEVQPTAAPETEHSHDDAAMHGDDASGHMGEASEPTTGLIVVRLAARNGSGVDGRAEIMPIDGGAKTQIGVYVSGIVEGSSHMNHIHMEASCSVATPGPHAADLTDIASTDTPYGRSLTVIDVPFSIVANGEHTIRVHAGATGGDKATVACGEIPAQPEEHGHTVSLPSTGHGGAAAGALPSWIVALVLAGTFIGGVGAALRSELRTTNVQ